MDSEHDTRHQKPAATELIAPPNRGADSWRDFQNRFMQLAREEQGRADVITNGKALRRMEVLRAHCDYKDYRERVFVAEEVRSFYEPLGVELTSEDLSKIEAKMLEWTELEKKAGLKAPETGRWTYGTGAVSENFRERVRLCVAEAGRALPDYPKGTDPEDFWLHRLYLDLLRNKSDLLICGTKEGGLILSVCVASATFCARLERQAIQQSEPGSTTGADRLRTGGNQTEPSLAQNSEKAAQSVESKSTNKQYKALTDREQNIWEVIQRGLKATPPLRGMTYCREVDAAKVSPPRKGIWRDAPRTYVAAYKSGDKGLVHWIQDEKSKIRRKAELAGLAKTRTKLASE